MKTWLEIARSLPRGVYDHKGECYNYSGWPGEEARCAKMPGSKSHEGPCTYPSSTIHTEEDQMNEALIQKLIELFTAEKEAREALIAELRKALVFAVVTPPPAEAEKPKRGRKKGEDGPPVDLSKVVIEHPCGCKTTQDPANPSIYCAEHQKNVDAANAKHDKVIELPPAKEPELGGHPHDDNAADLAAKKGGAVLVGDVTIEMIRERSTQFSNTTAGFFDMITWSALAMKLAGNKTVKGIDAKLYGLFYANMGEWIERMKVATTDEAKKGVRAALVSYCEGTAPSTPAAPAENVKGIVAEQKTLDDVKKVAAAFMAKNGEPALIALKKAFQIVKFSEMPAEKYASFIEACANA